MDCFTNNFLSLFTAIGHLLFCHRTATGLFSSRLNAGAPTGGRLGTPVRPGGRHAGMRECSWRSALQQC